MTFPGLWKLALYSIVVILMHIRKKVASVCNEKSLRRISSELTRKPQRQGFSVHCLCFKKKNILNYLFKASTWFCLSPDQSKSVVGNLSLVSHMNTQPCLPAISYHKVISTCNHEVFECITKTFREVSEIDHELFSTAILSLPLIQDVQLSVTGERLGTEYRLTV